MYQVWQIVALRETRFNMLLAMMSVFKEEAEDFTDALLLPEVEFLIFHVGIDGPLLPLFQFISVFIYSNATLLLKSCWYRFFSIPTLTFTLTYKIYAFTIITPISQKRMDHHHFLYLSQWWNMQWFLSWYATSTSPIEFL